MNLTLLVPELFWPEPEAYPTSGAVTYPALESMIARSQSHAAPAQSLEKLLGHLFGHSGDLPLAAWRRCGEADTTTPDENRWLCADPVHLRLHDERLILADSSQFEISLEEAQALVAALNEELPDVGRFHAAAPDRWYFQPADIEATSFEAPPLSEVAGRHIGNLLPDLLIDREWRRRLNAIQTVLHANRVNQHRADEGRMTLNSVWLWGDGKMPSRQESRFDGMWSSQTIACGLARAAGIPNHPRPIEAEALFEHTARDTEHLVVLDDLITPVRYDDDTGWLNALATLETHWFAPLKAALASGRLHKLDLITTTAHGQWHWECCGRDRWKFWHRPLPLQTLATEAARGPHASQEDQ